LCEAAAGKLDEEVFFITGATLRQCIDHAT
jgi:hypothetical protein